MQPCSCYLDAGSQTHTPEYHGGLDARSIADTIAIELKLGSNSLYAKTCSETHHSSCPVIRVHLNILVQRLDSVLLAPVLRILELNPGTIHVELARAQKSSVQNTLATGQSPMPRTMSVVGKQNHRMESQEANIQQRRIIMARLFSLNPWLIVPLLLTELLKLSQFPLLLLGKMVQVAREPGITCSLGRRGHGIVLGIGGGGIALRLAVVGFGSPQRHGFDVLSRMQEGSIAGKGMVGWSAKKSWA